MGIQFYVLALGFHLLTSNNAAVQSLVHMKIEVKILWPKINLFVKEQGRNPDVRSHDPLERRMAEAVLFLHKKRREAGL